VAPAFTLKDFLSSFMLLELFKGLRITGKYFFAAKITVQFPDEKTPLSPRFPRPARAAPLRERRGALHRLQAVRGVCPALAITIESEQRDDGTAAPRATTST
jgi:NADH-quinone oxidoreductase subunit I